MNRISVRQGDPIEATVEIRDVGGRSLSGVYAGTETVTARLWAGDNRATETAPTVAWLDATEGTITYDLAGSVTEDLDRGVYRSEVLVDGLVVWSGELEVLAGPGDATAATAYATYDGMIRRGGQWVLSIKDESSQSAFIEERHDAYLWTHRQVLARAKAILEARANGYTGNGEAKAIDETAAELDHTTIDEQLQWLAGLLDDGCLITDDAIVAANEHYACHVVVRRVMPSKDGNEPYRDHAAWHGHRARGMLGAVTFRFYESVPVEDEDLPDVLTISPV